MSVLVPGVNDLVSLYPEIAAEWNFDRNGNTDVKTIFAYSGKKYWWLGKCGHEWEMTVANRTKNHQGCPFCSSHRILPGFNDLLTLKPDLSKEWHPVMNGILSPHNVSVGSGQKVWWKGLCGHEWKAAVRSRVNGWGCPYCSGRRLLTGFNDLATKYPALAEEWHPTKNGSLGPTDVMSAVAMNVWWRGKCGHEWQATINSRSMNGNRNGKIISGCPICSGHRVLRGFNDLETTHPILAKEWHPTKNGNKFPYMFSKGSHYDAWWKCDKGHDYHVPIHQRVRAQGRGCPICSGHQVLVGFNDLNTVNPVLAAEWHPIKNGNLKSTDVTQFSNKDVWWLGKCGHEWKAQVCQRSNGTGCPVCWSGRQTSFAEKAIYYYVLKYFPDAVSRDMTLGKELDIYIPSRRIAIEYDGSYFHKNKKKQDVEKNRWCVENNIKLIRIRENGCPDINGCTVIVRENDYSSSLNKVIVDLLVTLDVVLESINVNVNDEAVDIDELHRTNDSKNSLAMKFPDIAKQWHPVRNGLLRPEMYSYASTYPAWWICDKGHEWQVSIGDRTIGHNCPICANQQVLAGYNDLITVAPELVNTWHPTKNGNLKPSDVVAGTDKKVWWLCPFCGHEWFEAINKQQVRSYCPVCNKRKKVCKLRKTVKCVETNKIYHSVDDAGMDVGRNGSNISACLNGRVETSAGFHWEFVDDYRYPENLVSELGLSGMIKIDMSVLEKQIDMWLSDMSERDQNVFFRYYQTKDSMSSVGKMYGVTKHCVWDILQKCLACIERKIIFSDGFVDRRCLGDKEQSKEQRNE